MSEARTYVEVLVRRARAAQAQIEFADQQRIDDIVARMARAGTTEAYAKQIAELAVDPTKWQPHRTMPYIENLLKEQFPEVQFIPMQDSPIGLQVSEDRVINALAARKPDAVIIGNAG